MVKFNHLGRIALIRLIEVYRFLISPFLGYNCRFQPTCSQYAIDAIAYYGVFKGSIYIVHRLLRCHPWHAGGHDPIHESFKH